MPIFAVVSLSALGKNNDQDLTNNGTKMFEGKYDTFGLIPTVGLRYLFLDQGVQLYGSGEVGLAIAGVTTEGLVPGTTTRQKFSAAGVGLAMGIELGMNIPLSENLRVNLNGGYQEAQVSTLKVRDPEGNPAIANKSTLRDATGKNVELDLSGPYLGAGLIFNF
ncbi:MAG: hypothetical protein EOP09_07090 [Proteobacteria bacterium]|nr:MAG: hypothetical protein EOP09_07090 [Pseudomonadota bacterium]